MEIVKKEVSKSKQIKGPSAGFQGSPIYEDYDLTVLTIDSGFLSIRADYCTQYLDGFQLNGSHVFSPEGAYYDHGSRCLVTANGPVRDYLEIRPGTVGVSQYPANEREPSVYPNPTDDLLHIELASTEIADVALYDLQGRVVMGVCDTPLPGGTVSLNVKSVPAGVYLLRVTDAKGREHHRKIVKR